MQYTAIIKDGGLFIPNVFSDLNDGSSHIVQVEVDIEDVRQQLDISEALIKQAPKAATSKKAAPKVAKKPTKQALKKAAQQSSLHTSSSRAVDELEAFDDGELSEIFKAYVNDGQISLENL